MESDFPHIQSVAAIPQIIEESIYIDSEANKDLDKKPNVVVYQHFECGLKIGAEDYTVHSLVAVDHAGNRYYDHNLTHIEKTKLLDSIDRQAVNGQGFGTTPGTKPTTLFGYKVKKLLALLQIDSSKVVDVNGEPLFWGLLEELLFEPHSHRDIVEAIHCVGYRYCYHNHRRTHPHAGRGGRIGVA